MIHFLNPNNTRMRRIVSVLTGLKEVFAAYAGVSFALGNWTSAIVAVCLVFVVSYAQEYMKPYWAM